jgi:hypothetical protein
LTGKGVISSKAVSGHKTPIYRQTGNKSKFFNLPQLTPCVIPECCLLGQEQGTHNQISSQLYRRAIGKAVSR